MAIDISSANLNSLAAYTNTASLGTGLSSAASTNSSGSTGSSAVTASNNTAALQSAVSLASDASVIVSLGANSGIKLQTYTAAGLFNEFVNAGSSADTSDDLTADQATQNLYQGILSGITSEPGVSGIYDGSGSFSSLSSGISSDLSTLLKSNPDLTSAIVGDVVARGIVGNLISTTA
ncbi:hypothetical protein PQR62_00275 [Herbaspirillum lusitanum]|uniref:Uncharacterized protein n=1 Tax=Herbaspirillum lusitanum TaxID=213312 RepID=A0ABW9A3S4_9BURK